MLKQIRRSEINDLKILLINVGDWTQECVFPNRKLSFLVSYLLICEKTVNYNPIWKWRKTRYPIKKTITKCSLQVWTDDNNTWEEEKGAKDQQTTHKATLLDLRKSLNSEKSSENCKLTLEMFPQCQIRRKSSKKPISLNKLKIRFIGIKHLLLTLIRGNEKRYPLASYVLKEANDSINKF